MLRLRCRRPHEKGLPQAQPTGKWKRFEPTGRDPNPKSDGLTTVQPANADTHTPLLPQKTLPPNPISCNETPLNLLNDIMSSKGVHLSKDVTVGGHKVNAVIDTGAATTIINKHLAETIGMGCNKAISRPAAKVTQEHMSITLPNGAKVCVLSGDITTHKADALVNAANEDLLHAGALAKAICDAGGPSI